MDSRNLPQNWYDLCNAPNAGAEQGVQCLVPIATATCMDARRDMESERLSWIE